MTDTGLHLEIDDRIHDVAGVPVLGLHLDGHELPPLPTSGTVDEYQARMAWLVASTARNWPRSYTPYRTLVVFADGDPMLTYFDVDWQRQTAFAQRRWYEQILHSRRAYASVRSAVVNFVFDARPGGYLAVLGVIEGHPNLCAAAFQEYDLTDQQTALVDYLVGRTRTRGRFPRTPYDLLDLDRA